MALRRRRCHFQVATGLAASLVERVRHAAAPALAHIKTAVALARATTYEASSGHRVPSRPPLRSEHSDLRVPGRRPCHQTTWDIHSAVSVPGADAAAGAPNTCDGCPRDWNPSPGAEGVPVYKGLSSALAMEGVHPHIYGKALVRPGRKMGHVTALAPSGDPMCATSAVERIIGLKSTLSVQGS